MRVSNSIWGEIREILHSESTDIIDIHDYFEEHYLGNIPDSVATYVEEFVIKWPEDRRLLDIYNYLPEPRLEWLWAIASPLFISIDTDRIECIDKINNISNSTYKENIRSLELKLDVDSTHYSSIDFYEMFNSLTGLEIIKINFLGGEHSRESKNDFKDHLSNCIIKNKKLSTISIKGVDISGCYFDRFLNLISDKILHLKHLSIILGNLTDRELFKFSEFKKAKCLSELSFFEQGHVRLQNVGDYYDVTLDDYGDIQNNFTIAGLKSICNSPYLSEGIKKPWRRLYEQKEMDEFS